MRVCIWIVGLHGHTNTVWSVAYSPYGDQRASGSHGHTVKVWQLATGECTATFEVSPFKGGGPYCAMLFATKRRLFTKRRCRMVNFKTFPRSCFSSINRPLTVLRIWGLPRTLSQSNLESRGDP